MDGLDNQALTYAGLGATTLVVAASVIWALARRMVKRSNREGDLDDRAVRLNDSLSAAYKEILDEQRATIGGQQGRIDRMLDELSTTHRSYGDLVSKQHDIITAEVAKVRDESRAAIADVSQQLQQCRADHQADRVETLAMKSEMQALRQQITDTFAGMKPAHVNVRVQGAQNASHPAPEL